MLRVAYLFERFPSFNQTFCYREVAELIRQGVEVTVFSIRRPAGELPQKWDEQVLRRVTHLPGETELVAFVDRAVREGKLGPSVLRSLREWDRQPDFLRLFQAVFVGLQLEREEIGRVHAHFAGLAARTAYWVNQFFGIDFSLTAHANDIFAPRDFVVSLEKIFAAAKAIVTVSDYAVEQLKRDFPHHAARVHRVYNGVDTASFQTADFAADLPTILAIGRLIEKKGFADLVSACARLKESGRRFTCKIIGEGPLHGVLSKQIADADLMGEVHLVGPRSEGEIVNQLANATVFVLPCTLEADGRMDNLPTVIMEA
ncbi:MAG: glycosyltransferase, partial [Chthoniobacterales bacterium]|nr:glycosyltransferase [Chthoniobacterales bacterium]